jgi:nucleoside-diphosphate-sugar epimerase
VSTYLITGVAGFIGSNLAEALLERGETVRGVDNFATGKRENLATLKGLDLVEGDITDAALMKRALRGVDYVLHHAAIPSVPRSVADPIGCHHANATGTLVTLEAARHARSVKRFVYAASSSAYGDTPTLPKIETMPVQPLSPYAVAKLAGEHYVATYARLYDLATVRLRYFNIFGPRQDPENQYAAVIPKFSQCALRGEAPPIFGDGLQSRDFTYVGNAVDANLLACTAPNVSGELMNIACGTRFSLLELVQAINSILGTHVSPKLHPARPGDVRDSQADITKARTLLGYHAAIDFHEGLRRTIAAMQKAPRP